MAGVRAMEPVGAYYLTLVSCGSHGLVIYDGRRTFAVNHLKSLTVTVLYRMLFVECNMRIQNEVMMRSMRSLGVTLTDNSVLQAFKEKPNLSLGGRVSCDS